MKIMQINAQMGYLLAPLLELIRNEKPDIICAQEVFRSEEPISIEHSYQTLSHIREAGEFEYVFFSPTWSSTVFNSSIDFGNVIFSKYPLKDQTAVFTSNEYVPLQTAKNWVFNARNLQTAKVEANSPFTVANHQGFIIKNEKMGGSETLMYTQRLAEYLKPHLKSLVFCTDLNIVKESPAFAPIEALGLRNLSAENNVATTLSTLHRAPNNDSVACDFIFCSPNLKINNFYASDEPVSDHKALFLEFEI